MYVVIVITIDVMDVSSENQDNIKDDIYKLPLDANGNNLTERMQKLGEKKSRAGGEERNEKTIETRRSVQRAQFKQLTASIFSRKLLLKIQYTIL